MILCFEENLFNNMDANIYVTFNGVTSYDAQRNVKFMLKTSSKNVKLKAKYLPVVATLEEANAYGLKHGLGTFFGQHSLQINSEVGEDPDFDVDAFVRNVKRRKEHSVADVPISSDEDEEEQPPTEVSPTVKSLEDEEVIDIKEEQGKLVDVVSKAKTTNKRVKSG